MATKATPATRSGSNAAFKDKVSYIHFPPVFELHETRLQGKPMELRMSNMVAAKGLFVTSASSTSLTILCSHQ